MGLNVYLDDDVRDRVEALDRDTCEEWGGFWSPFGYATVVDPLLPRSYVSKTTVTNGEEALDAFSKYTAWFDHVLETANPQSDTVVLLPCGSQKPIGTSAIHRKKLDALRMEGYIDSYDLAIVSEPCTIVPHGRRLAIPAVNYDFPPEFTDPDDYPEVFEVFTDRLARWIDETGYDRLVCYLVKGHQEKIDAALEKCDSDPEVIRVPGSSVGIRNGKVCGDMFRSTEDVADKLRYVRLRMLGLEASGFTEAQIDHYAEVL